MFDEKMTLCQQLRINAQENKIPIVSEETLAVIKFLSGLINVKKVLEIGTAIGYFAVEMAYTFPDAGIDTIERNEKMLQEARLNIKKAGVSSRINIYPFDALEIDVNLLDKDYDLIFIDAAKAQNGKFFQKFSSLLKGSGLIVTDNIGFHGYVAKVKSDDEVPKRIRSMARKIASYIDFLKENKDYQTIFLPVGDGIAVTMRKKNACK